jgi:transcriptional regulator with XRE-family HTH domain
MSVTLKRPIDRHIGGRVRAFRERRQLSLEALASRVGLTDKQLGAYESGERMRAWTLYALTAALDVPLARIFAVDQPPAPPVDELARFASSETTQLLQAWRRLDPGAQRRALLAVQAVAGAET